MRTNPTLLVKADDPVLSFSSTDHVEQTRSHLQMVKEEALKMSNAGLAVSIVGGVSDNINQVLDTAGQTIPSIEFLAKCKIVSDHLGFVVRAVDTIAEVCPLICKQQFLLRSLFL